MYLNVGIVSGNESPVSFTLDGGLVGLLTIKQKKTLHLRLLLPMGLGTQVVVGNDSLVSWEMLRSRHDAGLPAIKSNSLSLSIWPAAGFWALITQEGTVWISPLRVRTKSVTAGTGRRRLV